MIQAVSEEESILEQANLKPSTAAVRSGNNLVFAESKSKDRISDC